jgi:DsbC/DsbD-like thiol-disulfide interchange protein
MRLAIRPRLFWLFLAVLAALVAGPTLVLAGDRPAARFDSDAVALTLVAEAPGADGSIRAALAIDLAPGWKTYWRDPGEAGIAPSLDLSGSSNAVVDSLSFPAPHRFGDDYASSNGYSGPMAIALRLRRDPAGTDTVLRAKIFIGVCRDICIPVAADLTAVSAEADAGAVAAAFDALPESHDPAQGILGAALSADRTLLTVTATTGGAERPDLFVAGPEGWAFGVPTVAEADNGRMAFTLPVLSKPRRAGPAPPPLDIVMTSAAGAIEARSVIPGARP